jgi:hypothetical protein
MTTEQEEKLKVNMTDKYAHEFDPTAEVRVLTVDGTLPGHPVVVQDKEGRITRHTSDGTSRFGRPNLKLVPLEEPLPEGWVNIYQNGRLGAYHASKAEAQRYAVGAVRTIHLREVQE